MSEKVNIFEKSKVNSKSIENFKYHVPDIANEEHQKLAIKIFEEHSKNEDTNVSNAAKEVLAYFRDETLKKLGDLDKKEEKQSSLIPMQAANNESYQVMQIVNNKSRWYRPIKSLDEVA